MGPDSDGVMRLYPAYKMLKCNKMANDGKSEVLLGLGGLMEASTGIGRSSEDILRYHVWVGMDLVT